MMSLVSVLGCGTWFFLIEEQLYCVARGRQRTGGTLGRPLGRRGAFHDAGGAPHRRRSRARPPGAASRRGVHSPAGVVGGLRELPRSVVIILVRRGVPLKRGVVSL